MSAAIFSACDVPPIYALLRGGNAQHGDATSPTQYNKNRTSKKVGTNTEYFLQISGKYFGGTVGYDGGDFSRPFSIRRLSNFHAHARE
jgi:hypothetical protein